MFSKLINSKKSIGLGAFVLLSNAASAQEAIETVAPVSYDFNTDAWVTGIVLLAAVVIVVSFFVSMKVVRLMADELRIARLKEAGKWTEADEEVLVEKIEKAKERKKESKGSFIAALTDAVPLEHEEDVLTDHDYDGIQELDNNLPPWWVALFYITTIFGVVYVMWFHVLDIGKLPGERYEIAVQKAHDEAEARLATSVEAITESTVTLLTGNADLSKGGEIYAKNCATCHDASGGGLLGAGPNLTDQYWVHGGDIKDLFKTVKYGVLSKGMIAWKDQLRPEEIQQVSSFILSLQGTNPEGGLEPQGELYEPEVEGEEEPEAPAEEETEVTDEATATAHNVISLTYEQEQIDHR